MGWILQQHGWTVLHLPAFAETAADPVGRQLGEALWPSHYPVEALEAIRADVGGRVFQTLYQGNVSASQGTIFKRDWFQHYQQRPEKFTRIVQSWDTAFKTGATNDYSVCATFGETQNGFYLLALYRAKVEFPELKRQVALQANFWRPSEIYVEDKASGQSLIQELKLATTCPVIPVKIDRDKETRASAVTGYFESGRVLFPEGAAWLADLEDELASFPGGLHDDCVDAISQALNRLRDASGLLGVIDYFKDLFAGKRKLPATTQEILQEKAKPTQARVEGTKGQRPPSGPCPACHSKATIWKPGGVMGNPWVILCNQCSAENGVLPPKLVGECCGAFLRQVVSNEIRCGNCGQQWPATETVTVNGVSRDWYEKNRGFGRFASR
jgi:predicted phage terminase large subunit-like protein